MKTLLPAAFFALLAFMPMTLEAEVSAFPDNHSVRQRLADVITAPTDEVLAMPSAVYQDVGQGAPVKFEVLTQQGDFYLLFTNEQNGRFPLDSKGSYIIRRRERDGSFVQVKIFLNGSPGSFIRIYPAGERSRMDLYLFGYRLYRNVTIPLRFREILTDSFSKVIALTTPTVDWSLVLPARPLPEDQVVEAMVNEIRRLVPLLARPSGVSADSKGRFVETRNPENVDFSEAGSAGLAKWVIDGLYLPRTGRLIGTDSLIQRHLELRGNAWSSRYEQARNPYFGLDWTRNLAVALTHLEDPSAGPQADDVKEVPFFQYVDNVGYPIDRLKLILYELAVRNPGYFYLGAVNREQGTSPVLRQFTHIAVFFPYFDAQGLFRVAVLERGLANGLASFEQRYTGAYVHLVRVAASTDFAPPVP